jgi:hypothetical protein
MGTKMLNLRDNQLKNKRNRVEFSDETYKDKKNCQNFAPLFNAQITS